MEYRIEYVGTVGSTSDEIKLRASGGEEEGLVIIADSQTNGRGRIGRTFLSPAGTGLYMSLLLRPKMSGEEASHITTMAASAMAIALEKVSGRTCGIKWVNDLIIDGRKVCGILTEAAFKPGSVKLDYVVLGIGVNLADPEGGFDETIRDIAGSVFGNKAPENARVDIVAAFLEVFDKYCSAPNSMRYISDYRARSIAAGKRVCVLSPAESFEAVVLGIDDDCGLIVRRDDGREQTVTSGEISIRL